MEKQVYETPALVEIGSLEEITQATAHGLYADATIPTGHLIAGHAS